MSETIYSRFKSIYRGTRSMDVSRSTLLNSSLVDINRNGMMLLYSLLIYMRRPHLYCHSPRQSIFSSPSSWWMANLYGHMGLSSRNHGFIFNTVEERNFLKAQFPRASWKDLLLGSSSSTRHTVRNTSGNSTKFLSHFFILAELTHQGLWRTVSLFYKITSTGIWFKKTGITRKTTMPIHAIRISFH